MAQVKGDLVVIGTSKIGRNQILGLSVETVTTSRSISVRDYAYLKLSAATTQDAILPDATSTEKGFNVTIEVAADSAASINVMTFHSTTPVLLKNILSGKKYKFTLTDNSSSAGIWSYEILTASEVSEASRYIHSTNATTGWGSASAGYYTITVAASTHNIGTNPTVVVQELTGPDYIDVIPDRVYTAANGDVSVRVPDTPDTRFAGRIIIL